MGEKSNKKWGYTSPVQRRQKKGNATIKTENHEEKEMPNCAWRKREIYGVNCTRNWEKGENGTTDQNMICSSAVPIVCQRLFLMLFSFSLS